MKLLSRTDEIVMLAIWRLGDNAYGVTIREEIGAATGKNWSFGAIHVTLNRLERKGLVRSHMSGAESHRGGRSKRLFTLRPAGRELLTEMQRLQVSMWAGIDELSLEGS